MSADDDKRPDRLQDHPLLDFPEKSGDKDCPRCQGRGVLPVMVDLGGGRKWPGGGTQDCDCVYKRDLLRNVQRVWKVLLTVESVEESPLLKLTNQSLWITASSFDFRRHLRYVAFRKGPKWDARVVADSTLVTAWLARQDDVFDADVLLERTDEGFRDRPSLHHMTLVDLAVPYELLIIQLGVKAAKNRETPNVLTEAINEREQQGKPTWVVDSPIKPLAPGHIAYNDVVLEILDGFKRVILSSDQPAQGAAGMYKAHSTPQQVHRADGAVVGMSTAAYVRRKPGMSLPDPVPKPPPEVESDPGPLPTDPDGVSNEIDDLLAEALDNPHDFKSTKDGRMPSEDAFDPEQAIADFPDIGDLGGNASRLPAFLTRKKGMGK